MKLRHKQFTMLFPLIYCEVSDQFNHNCIFSCFIAVIYMYIDILTNALLLVANFVKFGLSKACSLSAICTVWPQLLMQL